MLHMLKLVMGVMNIVKLKEKNTIKMSQIFCDDY
jgi:hypothetical protein